MTPLRISYGVPDDWIPAVAAAAEQLGEALQDGSGLVWPTRLSAWSDAAAPTGEPCLVVTSLAMDLVPLDRSLADVLAVWNARVAAIPEKDRGRFNLCTILHAVEAPRREGALLERIRRLNLATIELSREFGVAVVDIDRALSYFGAELSQTGYRLQGARAAEAAGHVIAAALLGTDLCGLVASDRQGLAVQRHGRLAQMGPVVDRRLQRASRGQADVRTQA